MEQWKIDHIKKLLNGIPSFVEDISNITIELANTSHIDYIWELNRELLLDEIENDSKYLPKGYYDPYLCETKSQLVDKVTQNKWFIIKVDEVKVGTYFLLDASTITCDLFEFSNFIIDKDARGLGIGSIVMKRLIKQYSRKLLVAQVSPRNVGFYNRFGLGICKTHMCVQEE